VNDKEQVVFRSSIFIGIKMIDEGGQTEGRQIALYSFRILCYVSRA